VEERTLTEVSEFCHLCSKHLCSILTHDGRDISTRLGKANANSCRLHNIWRSKSLKIKIKIWLHESLMLSAYVAETWRLAVANTKKIETGNIRWLRKLSWELAGKISYKWRSATTNRNDQAGKRPEIKAIAVAIGLVHRMAENQFVRRALNRQPDDGYIQEAWTTTDKLDGNHSERPTGYGNSMGWRGGRGGPVCRSHVQSWRRHISIDCNFFEW